MPYPDPEDSDFYQFINKKYKKYKIPKKKKTMEQICFPKEFELQPSQQFLAQYINPKSPYKGVLVFHRIGSGKTCTAINIAEQWKHQRKIMVLVPASLVGNFRDELRSACAGNNYLKPNERERMKQIHPASDEYKEIITRSDKRIDKYYRIYSYHKFVELYQDGEISFHNTLLIVDEIQNMVSEEGLFYDVLYSAIHEAPASTRIVLLSATPMFDKPIEIALTMNLLRIPYEFPTGREFEKEFINIRKNPKTGKLSYSAKNLDVFKERIRGYVSYYRGAPPYVFPETTIKYVKCEMSEFQYRSYITVESQEARKFGKQFLMRKYRAFRAGEILELPNNFFIGTRFISNIAFPNRGIGEEGYKSLRPKHLELENLQTYSCKFYAMMMRINRSPGPVFVYSNFKEYGGLKSFIKVLEAQGYVDYAEHGEGKKRFALFTGDENRKYKDEIKAVYNQPANYNGSRLKIICGSPSMREGVSLANCRQVHIMEPMWNISKRSQVEGRSVRMCSHKLLPEDKRNVKIYIYLAVHPDLEESVDEYMAKLAQIKNSVINQFELALKEVAIDCELFKSGNVYPGEDDIECEA